ncbi:MAG: hypothetical protein HZB25_04260 [Candidatus Eisenbacteria bacterium]|nr:hypothetical protein [Candidatus Eisenbacteria bacterium]
MEDLPTLRFRAALLALTFAAPLLAGCGLSRQAPLVFRASNYALAGRVYRHGRPVADFPVRLYDQNEVTLLDSVRTDEAGDYGFRFAPGGEIEVRVGGTQASDFSYVRVIRTRASADQRDSLPPMDLTAFGCSATAPTASALPAPTFSAPLTFRWVQAEGQPGARYQVRIRDAADSTVWESTRGHFTTAVFNGLGTAGPYAGLQVPPGTYSWRVKVHLDNHVQAATEVRSLTFTEVRP